MALDFLQDMNISPESLQLDTQSSSTHVTNVLNPRDSLLECPAKEPELSNRLSSSQTAEFSQKLAIETELGASSVPRLFNRSMYPPKRLRVLGRLLSYGLPIGVVSVSVTGKTTTAQGTTK